MRLKTQILAATVLMLLVPLGALGTLMVTRNGGTVPGPVLLRYLYLTNWIGQTIHQGPDGRPRLEVTKVPLGMSDLVVIDRAGTVVWALVDGVVNPPEILNTPQAVALGAPAAGKRFFWQSLSARGQVYGSVLAAFSFSRPSGDDPLDRFDWVAAYLFGLLATALFLGLWLSRVSLQVSRLKLATDQLIQGRWDQVVSPRGLGTAEFRDLADKMEALRRALVAEQQKRARFLAGVSHDLKTPLTSIQGYVDALDDGMAEDPETMRGYLAIIRRKGQLLDQRLSDLLDWARIEAEDWRPRLAPHDLGSFLADLCQSLREDAQLLGLALGAELPAPGRYSLAFDEVLVTRALENLVANAFQHSPAGGQVRVAFAVLEKGLQIAVEDQGPGIPPKERLRVFEPFYRGEGASPAGRGLGLYIARTILAAHGWTLSLEAAAGGGARFAILIPFRAHSPEPGSRGSARGPLPPTT